MSAAFLYAATVAAALVAVLVICVQFYRRLKMQRAYYNGGKPSSGTARSGGRAKKVRGIAPAEIDRRYQGDDEVENVPDSLERASTGVLGRALARAKSMTQTPEHKLSLSRHDSAQEVSSWADAEIELQPDPGHLTSLFPAADAKAAAAAEKAARQPAAKSGAGTAATTAATTPAHTDEYEEDEEDEEDEDAGNGDGSHEYCTHPLRNEWPGSSLHHIRPTALLSLCSAPSALLKVPCE